MSVLTYSIWICVYSIWALSFQIQAYGSNESYQLSGIVKRSVHQRMVGPECPLPQPAGDYAVMFVKGQGSRKQVLYQCQPRHIWKAGQSSISCERGAWGPGDSLRCKPLVLGTNRRRLRNKVVKTEVGTFIGRYQALPARRSVLQFLGMRYGQKAARFSRAEGVPVSLKVVSATEFSPACSHRPVFPVSTEQTLGNQDEDCLFLNVYTPWNAPVGRLPVVMYIHGGFYRQGSGGDYDASTLSAFNDIVVVTINYRLGILGFLSSGTRDLPGNLALWDVKLALEWVRSNIAAFGGDPKRVTIMGHSSGSVVTSFLANSLKTEGLFSQAIMLSGYTTAPWAFNSNPSSSFDTVSEFFSCNAGSIQDKLQCLREVPLSDLISEALPNMLAPQSFAVVKDGEFVMETPAEFQKMAFTNQLSPRRTRLVSSRRYMTSSTSQEGHVQYFRLRDRLVTNVGIGLYLNVFFPQSSNAAKGAVVQTVRRFYGQQFDLSNTEQDVLSGIDILGDSLVVVPQLRMSDILSLYNSSTYACSFDFLWDPQTRDGPLFPAGNLAYPESVIRGSGHDEILYYIFGYPLDTRAMLYQTQPNFIEEDREMARLMMSYTGNFIKTGDPNGGRLPPGSSPWRRFYQRPSSKGYSVLLLQNGSGGNQNVKNFNSGERNLWDNTVSEILA